MAWRQGDEASVNDGENLMSQISVDARKFPCLNQFL